MHDSLRPVLRSPTDPVDAVVALVEEAGWQRDPTSPRVRWQLPGTGHSCRIHWYTTLFYVLEGWRPRDLVHLPTGDVAAIAAYLERVALSVKAIKA